jgi:dolichol-phosphate mannosyltransferase
VTAVPEAARAPVDLSIVLSFRNEAAVIPELVSRLERALAPLAIEYELVFVNDASTDDSRGLLTGMRAARRRLRIINMSRRFGPSACAIAGLAFARGAGVVLMDADLQDPPELIPELVERWRAGADVVYTVRTKRQGESRLKMFGTRVAYRLVRAMSDIDLPVEAGDFRLLNRRVVDALLALPERTPYLRGLVTWVGFTQVPVYYERQPRFAGRTHFPWSTATPWRTFVAGLTAFSSLPMIGLLPIGLAICLVSVAAAVLLFVKGSGGDAVRIDRWLLVAVAFLGGFQIASLGIVGIYLARVHDDVRGRPRYIVESIIGDD